MGRFDHESNLPGLQKLGRLQSSTGARPVKGAHMRLWQKFIRALDWISRVKTFVELLVSLGLGAVFNTLLIASIPSIWRTPIWLLSSAAILSLIAWGIPWLIHRKATEDQAKTDSPEKTWCEVMVEEDAKRTSERIAILSVEPQPHYGESEPYIDFRITLINATVFRIETSKIEGQTYYGRTPLMQSPNLFDVKRTNSPSSLYHGEKTTLVVQQPLSSLTIDNLQGARGIVKLDFNRVSITFTVRDGMPGAPESFKWPIGDLIVATRN